MSLTTNWKKSCQYLKEYYSFIEDYWAFTIDFKKMKVKCLFQYTYTDVLFH